MIEFEHSLFKLLLLVAVLSARPPSRRWVPFLIAGGLLLAFLPPAISLPIPWEFLLGLTIPLLLWQNARRIISAQWAGIRNDVLLWIGATILFAVVFLGFKELEIPGAVLFGLVAASMIWSAAETERTANIVSLIGPFTLIFLLAEVEPMVQTPTRYLGGIFSGLSFGAVIALLAIYVSNKSNLKARSWIALGQIYLAYGFAVIAGISAVAAGLASVIVYVAVGMYINLWPSKRVEPAPLNTWPGFVFVLVLFLLLGWQAHYPPSSLFWLEIIAGFILSWIIAWIGQRLKLDTFPQNSPLWRISLRVALLLFPALLIWPRNTIQQPEQLAYAIGISILVLAISRLSLTYFFEDD